MVALLPCFARRTFIVLWCCSAPPLDLVAIIRRRLAHRDTVLGGFRTVIDGSDGVSLRFMTWHHLVKVRNPPVSWAVKCSGIRCFSAGREAAGSGRVMQPLTDPVPFRRG